MSRRSRRFSRAVAGQGGPYTWPSRRLPLPLSYSPSVATDVREAEHVPQPFVARVLRPNVQVLRLGRSRRPPSLSGGERPAFSLFNVLGFRAPARVLMCVRRKSRREVLFAFRRAGFRGSAPKKHYRRTQDSLWRC